MESIHPHNEENKIKVFLIGLVGTSFIILIHEMGHFLAAHLFNIPTPTFSIGFGPALVHFPVGQISFQLALLPFGGYVEINQEILAQQPYMHKIIVALAGILFNIIFAATIMLYYRYKKITKSAIQSFSEYFSQQTQSRTF